MGMSWCVLTSPCSGGCLHSLLARPQEEETTFPTPAEYEDDAEGQDEDWAGEEEVWESDQVVAEESDGEQSKDEVGSWGALAHTCACMM